MIVFASSHILFCHTWLLLLRNFFFSNKRQKEDGKRGGKVGSNWKEKREGETRIYGMGKEPILEKNALVYVIFYSVELQICYYVETQISEKLKLYLQSMSIQIWLQNELTLFIPPLEEVRAVAFF